MSVRTVTNEKYSGLLESLQVPVELEAANGRPVARVGNVIPIHCATPKQVEEMAPTTHHYCDVFTDELFAPLGELALVRIDENTAEKVFINRNKRLLLISSDGRMAQWRCAGTFESQNRFVAGTPVCTDRGALASVLTARRGNHYAVTNFEGDSGYFETPEPWTVLDLEDGKMVYGDKCFSSREELRTYVDSLPAAQVGPGAAPRPVLWRGRGPRVTLVAPGGRQLAHYRLTGAHADHVDYL